MLNFFGFDFPISLNCLLGLTLIQREYLVVTLDVLDVLLRSPLQAIPLCVDRLDHGVDLLTGL